MKLKMHSKLYIYLKYILINEVIKIDLIYLWCCLWIENN